MERSRHHETSQVDQKGISAISLSPKKRTGGPAVAKSLVMRTQKNPPRGGRAHQST